MHKSKKRAFATQGMIFTANNEARSRATQIHCLRTRAFFSCLWMIRKVRIQWIFCAILTYWWVVLTIRFYHIYIYYNILMVIFRVYVYLPEGNTLQHNLPSGSSMPSPCSWPKGKSTAASFGSSIRLPNLQRNKIKLTDPKVLKAAWFVSGFAAGIHQNNYGS
jgi:hypothetical protein